MSHPLLARGPLTAPVILTVLAADGVAETQLPTRGRVVRTPSDNEHLASVPVLRVRVPTPALAAGATVIGATVDGATYDAVLDAEHSAPALGSSVDWRSTTYQLRGQQP